MLAGRSVDIAREGSDGSLKPVCSHAATEGTARFQIRELHESPKINRYAVASRKRLGNSAHQKA